MSRFGRRRWSAGCRCLFGVDQSLGVENAKAAGSFEFGLFEEFFPGLAAVGAEKGLSAIFMMGGEDVPHAVARPVDGGVIPIAADVGHGIPRRTGIARPAALPVEHEAGEAFAGGVGVEGKRRSRSARRLFRRRPARTSCRIGRFPDALARDDDIDVAGGGVGGDAGGFAGVADFFAFFFELLDEGIGDVGPGSGVYGRFGFGGAGEGCTEEGSYERC